MIKYLRFIYREKDCRHGDKIWASSTIDTESRFSSLAHAFGTPV